MGTVQIGTGAWYGTRTQRLNKITINRSTLCGSCMVMYRTGETKIFPFIFETCGTANEYNKFSWYYLKYGTGTAPLRRIILVRHNDENKKTIKKFILPVSYRNEVNTGTQMNLGKVVYISLKNKHQYTSNSETKCFVP